MTALLPPPLRLGMGLCLGLVLLLRGLPGLIRLILRSGVGFLFLALVGYSGLLPGPIPGANLFNALVLGVLGAPGFALLLLLPRLMS